MSTAAFTFPVDWDKRKEDLLGLAIQRLFTS